MQDQFEDGRYLLEEMPGDFAANAARLIAEATGETEEEKKELTIKLSLKVAVAFLLCLIGVVSTLAQSQYVHSVLLNNGAPVLREYVNPYVDPAMFPIVAVGKFSNASQLVDDIVTVDASGNISCLANNSDGTFSSPIVTSAIPISALPITASRVVTLPNSTSMLLLADNAGLNGNAGTSDLIELTFSGCKPTVAIDRGFQQGPINSIDQTGWVTFPVCFETQLGLPGLATESANNLCATQYWGGPFAFPSDAFHPLGVLYPGAAVIVGKFGAAAPVTFAFASVFGGGGNQIALSGEYFLGFIQTADGNIVAASSTNNQLFLDQVSLIDGDPAITSIGTYNLAGNPVGLVTGNFWNDTENGDLAVAAGNQVTIFTYVGAAGHPLWSLAETLTASGQICAIDAGSLVQNGSDIVVQVGAQAEVFSSQSFTELAPPPDPTPDPTPTPDPSLAVSPSSQTISAGASTSYGVTTQNFQTSPTLTVTCSIPLGSCAIVGGQVVATTTAPKTSGAIPVINPWTNLWQAPSLIILLFVAVYLMPKPKRLTLATACVLVLAGCNGGGSKSAITPTPSPTPTPTVIPGTPSGTYIIVVNATSGSVTTSATASLQVK
jgi:hypothetical protein